MATTTSKIIWLKQLLYCRISRYCTSRRFLYYMKIKLPFTLQRILFSMNEQRTSKSIVILADNIFSHQLLSQSQSLHNTNSHISSLRHLSKTVSHFTWQVRHFQTSCSNLRGILNDILLIFLSCIRTNHDQLNFKNRRLIVIA